MPTSDDRHQLAEAGGPPPPARRLLGRGPGTAPPMASGPDAVVPPQAPAPAETESAAPETPTPPTGAEPRSLPLPDQAQAQTSHAGPEAPVVAVEAEGSAAPESGVTPARTEVPAMPAGAEAVVSSSGPEGRGASAGLGAPAAAGGAEAPVSPETVVPFVGPEAPAVTVGPEGLVRPEAVVAHPGPEGRSVPAGPGAPGVVSAAEATVGSEAGVASTGPGASGAESRVESAGPEGLGAPSGPEGRSVPAGPQAPVVAAGAEGLVVPEAGVPVTGPEAGSSSSTGTPAEEAAEGNRFTVRLANFEGPFDLLLQLISKHKMDVTEVALSKVTNEFMAYLHAMGPDWDLDQTTEFLVVAATLLDLKAARLLPTAEVEDESDLALLEARDLLFARLLQYRAFKQIAAIFAERLEAEALHHPRTVGLEPQHAELLPEVVLSIGPERFAQLAVKAMQPKPKPQVYVEHIHAPLVSVREQAELVIARLRDLGEASFRDLTEDAPDTLTVVARFLALLELYREKAVALDQEEALGSLQVRWMGGDADPGQPLVTDEFDQETAAGPAGKDAKDD